MQVRDIMIEAVLLYRQDYPLAEVNEIAAACGVPVKEVSNILASVDLDWSESAEGDSRIARPDKKFWKEWNADKNKVRDRLKAAGMYLTKRDGEWLVCHE